MELTETAWLRFRAEAARLGLGLVHAAPLSRIAGHLATEKPPEGTSHIVVLAQTGGEFWERLRAQRAWDSALDRHPDPLDTMTEHTAYRLRTLLGEAALGVCFPFRSPADFVSLGEALGMGARSRLSILIHPEYGSWMAFRMLFFVRAKEGLLPEGRPFSSSPCDECDAPCKAACPGSAFQGGAGKERLDYSRSFSFRMANPGQCATACAARLACPVGSEYRYPPDFIEAAHRRAWAVGSAHLESKSPKNPTPPPNPSKQGSLF